MSRLKKILVALAIVIVVFVVVVMLRPAEFRVERSITIAAPPSAVFPLVNDYHRWNDWSPWAKLDPAMKVTFEGAPSGTGAIYSWAGNSQVGEGRSTIIESQPNELVRTKLEFFKPMPSACEADFTFKAEGGQTVVTWRMSGQNNFVAKAMHLIFDINKMLGDQFDEGLGKMKALAEAPPKP